MEISHISVIVSYKTVTPTRLSVYPMSAYFLENNQLKICQRNILEWQILLPYEWKKGKVFLLYMHHGNSH